MPGALPFVPPPDPEDEHTNQAAYVEESFAKPIIEEPKPFEFDRSEPIAKPSAATPTSEAELPLQAQGGVNGGPLGCCLGITVGIMLSLFLGVIGFGNLLASVIVPLMHADAITNIRIAIGLLAIFGAILGGYGGWKIGKRVYREYELSPRQKKRLEQLEKKYQGQPRQVKP